MSAGVRVMRSADSAAGASSETAAAPRWWQPAKLLTPQLELLVDELRGRLSDSTDFTVVGVLGKQGSGKSTLMSVLAGWVQDGTTSPARGAGGTGRSERMGCGANGGSSTSRLRSPPFPLQQLQGSVQAQHATCGIDAMVTPGGLILLDTQPLLSASVLLSSETSLDGSAPTLENQIELQSLQIAMLIFSICHVVLLVQDSAVDVHWWRFLRTAMMLRQDIPDVSLACPPTNPSSGPFGLPEAIAGITGSALDGGGGRGAGTAHRSRTERSNHHSGANHYSGAGCRSYGGGNVANFGEESTRTSSARSFAQHEEEEQKSGHLRADGFFAPALVFALNRMPVHQLTNSLPSESIRSSLQRLFSTKALRLPVTSSEPTHLLCFMPCDDEEVIAVGHGGFWHEASMLRDTVLSFQRPPFARSGITEREWLKGVIKVWELVRTSSHLERYNDITHKLHLWA